MYNVADERAELTAEPLSTAESTAVAAQDAALNPRFYTTDFDEMNKLDFSKMRVEWDAMVEEFRSDPNRNHFKRTPEFDEDFSKLPPKLRQ
ncbi:MAG TPA: hypothetical protein VE861_12380, partial [Gemmatimonadaceae bacterium]|nr:hypothetical protein [Gemmatimonadaceae bacterium]